MKHRNEKNLLDPRLASALPGLLCGGSGVGRSEGSRARG